MPASKDVRVIRISTGALIFCIESNKIATTHSSCTLQIRCDLKLLQPVSFGVTSVTVNLMAPAAARA
jgi:hypothetical protein